MKTRTVGWIGAAGLMFLMVVLAGCTNVKGEYVCDGSLLDSLRLESGGKAHVTATLLGVKSERDGTYSVDGDKVNIVLAPGESAVFTLSGKTLDGGQMGGKCTMK